MELYELPPESIMQFVSNGLYYNTYSSTFFQYIVIHIGLFLMPTTGLVAIIKQHHHYRPSGLLTKLKANARTN